MGIRDWLKKAGLKYHSSSWGQEIGAWADAEDNPAWRQIVDHAMGSKGKSKPSKKWLKQAGELIERVGLDAFSARLGELVASAPLRAIDGPWGKVPEIKDPEQDLLKGLAWMVLHCADDGTADFVGQLAERAFRKIPGHGATSTRVANACVWTLGQLPDGGGVAHLSRLMGKVKTNSARRQIDRALTAAAEATGQTRADIEEIAVPDFGIRGSSARIPAGESGYQGELVIEDGQPVLRWIKPDGKAQKSAPKAVKEGEPDALKEIKRQHKELKALLAAQPGRLERLWLEDRRLPVAALRERYLEHPVVGQAARRLVWLVETDAGPVMTLWRDDSLRGLGGQPVALHDDDEARLFHLLDMPEGIEEVMVWRDYLDELGISQPFPQLWREVYRAEPGSIADERFAAHIIRQQPFRTLAQKRGWTTALQGYWDSYNIPEKPYPRHGIAVTFQVDPISHGKDDEYYFVYLMTGPVAFVPHEEGQYTEYRPLQLDEIPPVVFSEAMRDVDLFVASCTVANDPKFDPGGIDEVYSEYWGRAARAPLEGVRETRKRVLEQVIPRTTLRDCARVDGNELVVDGASGVFRLHIGSTRVRRDGDDEALSLDISRAAKNQVKKLLLPFEGDGMLSELLAKAFHLAAGDGI